LNSQTLKSIAVRTVKPRVSPTTWNTLRGRGKAASDAVATTRDRYRWSRASLTDIAIHFDTDKWGGHRYTPHYEHHLKKWRTDNFTLFEIGIGGYAHKREGGASLRMWKAFFPKANIVGLDIEDKSFVDEDRIKSYRGSQTDEALIARIASEAGPIRVVVDDGSHRPEHIRETFRILFPLLEEGGIYAIEDTQTSYWPRWGGSVDRSDPTTTMALVKDLIDGLNYEEFLDDGYEPTITDRTVVGIHAYHNLVIIEKGVNAEGTNRSPREYDYVTAPIST